MILRALVVDDEAVARRRLRRLLEKIGGVEVIAEARDGREALAVVEKLRPDVVFLDIRMPELDGLAVARSGRDLPPIVFTTAYDEHAVAAFEAAAVDYLLKPIEEDRLRLAVERVRERHARRVDPVALAALLERLGIAGGAPPTRLAARHGGAVHLLDPRRITRLVARGGYVAVRLGEREFLLEDSLAALEERLAPLGFVRVHRSELVRLDAIRRLRREGDGGIVTLEDGQEARVSRRALPDLSARLGIEPRGPSSP